jgi:hypothetical protein
LQTANYSFHAVDAIVAYVACEGTSEGAPGLEPVDYETAEWILETGCEPVPQTSAEWGSPSGDGSLWRSEDDLWALGPDHPADGDRRDFECWLESVDQPYPPADQAEEVRAWLDANPSFEQWLASEGGPQ